ncbi:hypothetical protein ACHQM5_025525 [Ranunculus cassubicifolius]
MAVIGLVVSKGADYLVEQQEVLLVRALHYSQEVLEADLVREIKTNRAKYKLLVTSVILLCLVFIGTIANEFIIYKLKEMEKITEEDIALLMKEFKHQAEDQFKIALPSDIKFDMSSLTENKPNKI